MPQLTLTLLGGFEARLEPGQVLRFPTRKVEALLAYLALPPGQPHLRDKLVALLWGETPGVQARASLRQALFTLRRALPGVQPAWLRVDGQAIVLDPAAVAVDVATFERRLGDGTPEGLDTAVRLYRGDLLAGLRVEEAPFEEWLLAERERLRERAIEALARLLAHQRESGRTKAALQTALQLAALDPLQEAAHRTLMRLYVQLGRRGAALRQYQQCVDALHRELQTEPEAETSELYRQILRQRPAVRLAGPESARPRAEATGPPPRAEPPPAETPLVGRTGELEELLSALDGGHRSCLTTHVGVPYGSYLGLRDPPAAGSGEGRLRMEAAPQTLASVGETALARVLSSEAFQGSPRLRRFLEYVVRHALAGAGDSIKEYTIAGEVFDRGPRFDPRCDGIVRVEALRLRQKLERYYRTDGATDEVAISLPKGAYRPVFKVRSGPPKGIMDDPDSLCWHARTLVERYTPEAIGRARDYLTKAIERWPSRPELYVALAEALLVALEMEVIPPSEGFPLLQLTTDRALRLDPASGEASFYAAIAQLSDRPTAISAARRAFVLSRANAAAHFWASNIVAAEGQLQDALIHIREASRLQPASLFFRTWIAVCLWCLGNVAEAREHLRDILEFDPRDCLANFWLGRICAWSGLYDEARQAGAHAYEVSGSARALCALGYVEARAGHVESARAILEKLATLSEKQYVALSGVARIHVALGHLPEAAAALSQARRHADMELIFASLDPTWTPFRGKLAGF